MKKLALALLLSLSMSSAFAADQNEGNSFAVWYYLVCFAAAPFAPIAAAGAIVAGTFTFASYQSGKENR